jgi:hypothetical protein
MTLYVEFVKANPIISAIIQFALLGTLGETASKWIIKKEMHFPFTFRHTLWKMFEWSFLAVCIKYAFIGFTGFIAALVNHSYLPQLGSYSNAFAISTSMNLQFGPFLVITHRLLDNLYSRENNWYNIDKGLYSLLWFWIPAHTITFMLPKEFQIGLAAVWSLVLGIILGYYNKGINSAD